MTPNTTCDVYRNGTAPPSAPAVAGVRGHLHADYWLRLQDGAGDGSSYQFTHILLVAADTDIRDGMITFSFNAAQNDDVYIPDQNGTRFRVVAVEIHGRGQPGAVRKVYLDRYAPTWPTNNL
ncbi:MAG TPA: hypothetical protein VEL76_29630 [Gemmataceae bacterium]|nr:hypothetical protein [Gemmataceae bacterium]